MKIFFVVPLLLLYLAINAQEQPVEIKKSTEKALIEGKVYFLHIIQPGQTIYSISKVYNVTLQDIVQANPGINIAQTRPGQTIRIPVKEVPVTEQQEIPHLVDEDFTYHEVKKGNTIYSISKKYNVPIEVIYSYNPETKEGLKTGMTLKLPKKKVLDEVIQAVRDDENFYYYEVKRKDTLYSLAKKYDVSIADIVGANPELRWGLKKGQILKIPKKTDEQIVEQEPSDSISADTIEFFSAYSCDTIGGLSKARPLNIALLLPFMSDQINRSYEDTINKPDRNSFFLKHIRSASGYFEFYQGILVALDTLKKSGYNINLNVFDTRSDTNETKRIITKMRAKMPDLIFGPVYPENIKLVLNFALKNSIPVISPFYNRTEQLSYYPEIFQVTPSRDIENKAIAEIISKYNDPNILVVHNGDTISNRDILSFRNSISSMVSTTGKKTLLNEMLNNDTVSANLPYALVPEKKNIIIILSDNAIYVNGILSKLDISSKRFDITVIGQPTWLSFQTVNIDNYHNLEVTISAPFYIDYKDRDTKSFVRMFYTHFGSEPSVLNSSGYNLSYLGYDVTNYFAKVFYKYGPDFYRCLPYIKSNDLLTNFSFSQINPGGGFENSAVNYIRFEKKEYKINKIGLYKLYKEEPK